MKKILVPTDFSNEANYAFDLACQIAQKAGSEVQLLHVIVYPSSGAFNTTGEVDMMESIQNDIYVKKLMDIAKDNLDNMVSATKDVEVGYTIQVGHPYQSISNEIANNNSDLLIMGTKGSDGMHEVFVGSNTEKVVRRAACPVLSVKQKSKLGDLKKIAFAVNSFQDIGPAITKLKSFQQFLDASLNIVWVNTPNNFNSDRVIRKGMKDFVQRYQIENYSFNIFNDVLEEDGIIHFAEEFEMDAIALFTHGRTGLSHLLSGSISEDVVNHASRPVWTFSLKHQSN